MTSLRFLSRHRESGDVYTYVFENNNISWTAGQYMAFVLSDVSDILEQYEHWFTISSAPHQGSIHITVRSSDSGFKQGLAQLKPGDTIQVHTVDGDFSWPKTAIEPVFIAGGIGITPFISMLRQRSFDGESISATLFYFNRPNVPIIFYDELESLRADHPTLTIHYLTEKPLTIDPFAHLLPKEDSVPVFIAGPVPMVDRLGAQLENQGMLVKRDWYFGYDIRTY